MIDPKSANPDFSQEDTLSVKSSWIAYIHKLQENICRAIENEDGQARFITDHWERAEGGSGKTRVIQSGKVFEKGGVNTSVVHGRVTPQLRNTLKVPTATDQDTWFACGLSLVLHPQNPFVPTVHANFRYFELYDKEGAVTGQWFGGGADLTPYYLFEEDAIHFHQTLKNACDPFGKALYPKFKRWCDRYFVNEHRDKEARGVGGLFYDHLYPDKHHSPEHLLAFSKAMGNAFLPAYLPIVQRRKSKSFNSSHKRWQEIRRGRYVEFNLIHDRGTIFGLRTRGRVESILMSLPPTVRFEYNYQPEQGSAEWKLLEACRKPRDWVAD